MKSIRNLMNFIELQDLQDLTGAPTEPQLQFLRSEGSNRDYCGIPGLFHVRRARNPEESRLIIPVCRVRARSRLADSVP